MDDETTLLRPKQAALLLGVTTDTLRRWHKEKRLIPVRTMGGHRRYRVEDVTAQLNRPAA